ncbi:MAG: peptidoglycan D,D-transpeptidase FtsI family protein [Thiohalomonadaceae bacterium]
MSRRESSSVQPARLAFVVGAFGLATVALLWRAVDLHVFNRDFLQQQGDARALRVVPVPAHRGMITDRQGEPLAISTPVESVWANPQVLAEHRDRIPPLAKALGMESRQLERLVAQRKEREFVYLQRHVAPEVAQKVSELDVPGVSLQREYRRYYPTGEVTGHVLGFTDVDDHGIEGIELMYDEQLRGIPGSKRVIRDRLGRIVENVASISEPRPGGDLRISVDRRIQYLAYRELKAAVLHHRARGGSAVVLDARTGEVLAMVNQPAYNPNNLRDRASARARNRAITDVFEPGSTVKPFTVAAALESGRFRPDTVVDTGQGFLRVGNSTVRDHHALGAIDVTTLLQKSSNVGSTLLALALPPTAVRDVMQRVGFGATTGSGFPGEASGVLASGRFGEVQRATLSYGYGLSVTPLQLAQAYTVLASDGRLRPVSFLARTEPAEGVSAISASTVAQVRKMLESVTVEGGTGTRARVPGYRVAGKTGTARKAEAGGYSQDRYVAVFAGFAPATRPRLAMVVMVDEPSASEYYGGEVAAPVFAAVMAGAMRLLDVPPDDLSVPPPARVADAGGFL